MNFNFEKTAIFLALKREKSPFFLLSKFLAGLFLAMAIVSLFLVGSSFIGIFSLDSALKIFLFLLVMTVFFAEANLFSEQKIKNPHLDIDFATAAKNVENYNLAELLNFESAEIINDTINFCKKKKISGISATALLFCLLNKSKQAKYIFLRLGLDASIIQGDIKNSLENKEKNTGFEEKFTDDFNTAIVEAVKAAVGHKHEIIEPIDILDGVAKAEFFKKILIQYELKDEDFENISLWFDYLEDRIKEQKRFWDAESLASIGSLGKDWTSGYTVTLDQYSIDWRSLTRKWLYKAIIGHEKEREDIQMILSRPGVNNVLIVGEPGVGRESVIEAIARNVYHGKSTPELNYYRVVELDMGSVLSSTKGPDELGAILTKIFSEVLTAGNIILVIKELHNYIGVEQEAGTADISGVLENYLKLPQFKFIGTTNYNGLHTRIEKNTAFAALFEKVEIGEISEMETIRILQNTALELEQKYKVFITYPSIRELVSLSARYIPNVPFPKKAIDLLQDVAIYVARSSKEKVVLPDHVDKVVSTKTEIPVGKVEFKEKEVLLNMENLLHERIVGQEDAIKEISVAMRRARAGIASKTRPMGTFLFLGPTGVGKTETAKALAQIYFGGEKKMIRLDMSEFQAISDIPRLIGATGQEGLLTTPIRENPFSLLLLDEIEKAHPNILNLFLQVLDEGNLTDGQGRKIIFTNCIIICTSNAGADFIFESVEKNNQINRDELLDRLFTKALFRPEFVNRFDATVIFKPLTKADLMNIAQLSLNSLKKNLKDKDIVFNITDQLKEKIVNLSYKPAFGAREMRRVIQDKVENSVAQALLSDKIKKGQSFEVSPEDFSLVVKDSD